MLRETRRELGSCSLTTESNREDHCFGLPRARDQSVETARRQHTDGIYLLLDMEDFKSERSQGLAIRFKFGHRFHDQINIMAIFGDKRGEMDDRSCFPPSMPRRASTFVETRSTKPGAWLSEGFSFRLA